MGERFTGIRYTTGIIASLAKAFDHLIKDRDGVQ